MKPSKDSWWHIHRDAILSGMFGFLMTSAILLWPIVSAA
ncbi:hypothetical protein FHR91_000028 [Erythrobacter lutimaris]|nr:hypothetical protein [Alteriqipengyuania lutimaris]